MIVDPSISQPQALPTIGVRSSQDIVDHLDKVLKAQPPEVQAAVDHAHGILGLQSPVVNADAGASGSPVAASIAPPAPATPAPIPASPAGVSPIVAAGSPTDAQPLPTPGMIGVTQSDLSTPAPSAANAPFMGGIADSAPKVSAPSAPAAILNPHMENLERMTKEGTGTNKIHNPFLRGLATVGDSIYSGLFPEFARFTPGTASHHQQLLGEEEGQLEQEQKAAKSTADVAHTTAQTGHEAAGEKYENQQADTLAEEGKRAPKADLIAVGDGLYDAKAAKWIKEPSDKDKEKLVAVDPAYGQSHHLVPDKDGKYYIPLQSVSELLKPPTVKEGEQALGPRVKDINAAMTARYQVLHPGTELPKHFMLPDEATQKDFDRTDKLLEGEEKAFGTKANQDQTNELRKQTMALAAGNREHKDETAIKQAAHKAFTPALDSGERFNVMAKNYEDAVKNHDQQAMLSLLANHLGMTMGLQKGARMTKDIIHEAEVSRPWLQGLKAKFDKDGYLSGVNLTPEQMRQMVSLGRERFAEDISKARSEAKYMGASDDGPERTPSRATTNHYLGEANGDLNKAKQLATQDGWTVK